MTNPSSEWRWADPTGQQRLVREDELRAALAAGTIPSNAPVWRPGWKHWKAACDVAELKAPGDDGVPPPPMFVVVAQKQFEGKPVAGEEPPPPPRYVPAQANAPPRVVPPADASGPTIVDPRPPVMEASKPAPAPAPRPAAGSAPRPRAVTAAYGATPGAPKVAPRDAATPSPPIVKKPPASPPAAKKPLTSKPPPLPKKAKSVAPPPLPTATRSATTTQVPPPFGPAAPPPSGPMAPHPSSGPMHKKNSVPPPLPARARSTPPQADPAASGRTTLPVAPAPPPMPKIEPTYVAPSEPAAAAAQIPASKFPTLMMFGEDAQPPPPGKQEEEAPPIVVPPPEPSNVTNAVTRPPPWGDGTVGFADNIPKAPASPMFPQTTIEDRPSDVGRQMELSSSDLTSEARLEVVKPAPLVAAERPRTMMGLGVDSVAKKEAPAPEPTEPTSLSEQGADTSPHLPPPAPSGSGDKLQDLREVARKRLSEAGVVARKGVTEAGSLAKRAYAGARERTKDKPSWFLPAVGGGALVVLVATIALVVHAANGSSSSAGATASASSSGAPRAAGESSAAKAAATAPVKPARPVVCALSGSPRTVAPNALVPSGVEVTALGSQIALGFATGPREGVLELLDPGSVATASSLHLRATEPIRRVLVYGEDKPQAALDSDTKTDALQGRRTLRANPPIDIGAMDGGLVWAPHGTDKGIKLWPLASDAPIQALRGEPLPEGKGFVVAFRQSGAIFVGAFGGNPPGPLGPLLRADGLGPQVGSPAVAASGDRVMVAWADRAGSSDPWGLRYAVARIGDDAIHPQSFTLPPGGLGEQGMSPGLSPLPAGAFLLLWTEGQVSDHQVRGAVFEGGAARDVFTASAEGVNAGQPQGAVLPDGRGAVAFLASTGKSFEVVATPIHCTEK